jgi:hypothetical protein
MFYCLYVVIFYVLLHTSVDVLHLIDALINVILYVYDCEIYLRTQ